MTSGDAGRSGDHWAGIYDAEHAHMDPAAEVELLASLAGDGSVLEFGIGTGRVGLPLAARGVDAHGIEASAGMVAQLQAKPDGNAIPVTTGDFCEVRVPGSFSLVYIVFNTLFSVPTQEAQVRCFQNAAAHLAPGGRFLVAAWVPDPAHMAAGSTVRPVRFGDGEAVLLATMRDPVRQRVDMMHIILRPDGTELRPMTGREAWPSELDLMARLAGLRLEARWGGWRREPFTRDSGSHVSVYASA